MPFGLFAPALFCLFDGQIREPRHSRHNGDGMSWQVDWRRVATGSAVLLLHLLILFALLRATGILPEDRIGKPREIELTLSPPPSPTSKTPTPVIPDQIPIPDVRLQTFVPRPITVLPAEPQKQSTPEGDIRALGRYLFNCSGQYYEELNEQEKEHCLRNRFNGKPLEPSITLGTAKASPFDKVIQDRNTTFQAPFTQCDPASINASLHNVPCTNFQNSHSILQELPGH
jgi:hypothetical protein